MYNSAHAILIGAHVSVGMKAGHGQAKACHWTLTPHVLSALNTCHTSETKFNAAFIFFYRNGLCKKYRNCPRKRTSCRQASGLASPPQRGRSQNPARGPRALSQVQVHPRGARSQRQGTAKYDGLSVVFLCRRRRHRHPDQTENHPFLLT